MAKPKPIALFDIDNTMYDGFSYFDLLKTQVDKKLISKEALEKAKARMQRYKSKLQDYETTIVELLDIYAASLQNSHYASVLQSTKKFYKESNKFFKYVNPVIQELRVSHNIVLVTGEPQFVAKAVGDLFGIQAYYSSEYEVRGGIFTGKVKRYLASRHEKQNAVKHLMKDGAQHSFAFGDSEGDIEMLRAVEHAICLNPTEGLRAIARKEGWHIPAVEKVPELITKLNTR